MQPEAPPPSRKTQLVERGVFIFVVVFAAVFLFATIKAGFAGKMKATLSTGALTLMMVWLAWQIIHEKQEAKRKYAIMGDQLISVDDPSLPVIDLKAVMQVIAIADRDVVILRNYAGKEIRQISLRNAIVPELRAYREAMKPPGRPPESMP